MPAVLAFSDDQDPSIVEHFSLLRFYRKKVVDITILPDYRNVMDEANPILTMKGCKCLHCSHQWLPRKPERTKKCPRCQVAAWDQPKTLAANTEVRANAA